MQLIAAEQSTVGVDSRAELPRPTVSWLMCSHVANDELRLAIESCLNQTFTDFELVFVANGRSADDIGEQIRQWCPTEPRLRILTTEVCHLTFSLSLGLHHARSHLVARMDGDDICAPHRLERQVAFMRTHPEVTVLGTAFELIDATGRPVDRVSMPECDADIRRRMLSGNPLCHPSVMFRREPILRAGGYLGGIYGQDYDLWTRLAVDRKNQFANLPDVCLGYRNRGAGGARKNRWAYASMAASQTRNFAVGEGTRWAAAALLTLFKALVRSRSDSETTKRS